MLDIAAEVQSIFQTTQILIVFILFLFTLFYSEIQEKIKQGPEETTLANKELLKEIKQTFWHKSFLLFVSISLIFLLYLTVFIKIVSNWSSEVVQFLLIFIFVVGFFFWSGILMAKLIWKIVKFKV